MKNIPEVVWRAVYDRDLKSVYSEPVEVKHSNTLNGLFIHKTTGFTFSHENKEEVERFMKFMEEVVSKRYSGAIKHIKEALEEVYEEVEKDLREEFEEKEND